MQRDSLLLRNTEIMNYFYLLFLGRQAFVERECTFISEGNITVPCPWYYSLIPLIDSGGFNVNTWLTILINVFFRYFTFQPDYIGMIDEFAILRGAFRQESVIPHPICEQFNLPTLPLESNIIGIGAVDPVPPLLACYNERKIGSRA